MSYTVTESKTEIVITIDKTKTEGVSASGKSEIIASSRGNVALADGLKMGLNVYRPRK